MKSATLVFPKIKFDLDKTFWPFPNVLYLSCPQYLERLRLHKVFFIYVNMMISDRRDIIQIQFEKLWFIYLVSEYFRMRFVDANVTVAEKLITEKRLTEIRIWVNQCTEKPPYLNQVTNYCVLHSNFDVVSLSLLFTG